jgi:hypothetical protein
MIRAVHNKLDTAGNGTKLSDYQFIANEIIEVRNMFLKFIRSIDVIKVGVIAISHHSQCYSLSNALPNSHLHQVILHLKLRI